MSEKQIQDAVIEALDHFRIYRTRVWRNNTGVAKYHNTDGTNRFIRFGSPGSADITGLCFGRRLEIEVKQPGSRQTDKQKEYENMILENGGIYYVATSVDEAITKLEYEVRYMQKTGWDKMIKEYYNDKA